MPPVRMINPAKVEVTHRDASPIEAFARLRKLLRTIGQRQLKLQRFIATQNRDGHGLADLLLT